MSRAGNHGEARIRQRARQLGAGADARVRIVLAVDDEGGQVELTADRRRWAAAPYRPPADRGLDSDRPSPAAARARAHRCVCRRMSGCSSHCSAECVDALVANQLAIGGERDLAVRPADGQQIARRSVENETRRPVAASASPSAARRARPATCRRSRLARLPSFASSCSMSARSCSMPGVPVDRPKPRRSNAISR